MRGWFVVTWFMGLTGYGCGVTHDRCDTGFWELFLYIIFFLKLIICFSCARARIFYKNMCHLSYFEEVFKRVKQQLMEAAFDDERCVCQHWRMWCEGSTWRTEHSCSWPHTRLTSSKCKPLLNNPFAWACCKCAANMEISKDQTSFSIKERLKRQKIAK